MENTKIDRVLKLPAVISTVGLGRSTIFNLIAKGLFPKQIKLSERSSGWMESDIAAWLEAKRPKAASE